MTSRPSPMPISCSAASRPGPRFGDLGRLDVDAARRALDRAGVSAEGVVRVVDAAMERAVRVVTVERGVDPRELALVAFGGAGPLHACAIADALGMRAVIVPPRAGVCSAAGSARARRRRARSCTRSPAAPLAGRARARRREARARVGADAVVDDRGRLPLRRAESRADGGDARRVPGRARAAQRARRARARRSRSSRSGRGRRSRHRRASPTFPTSTASRVTGPAVVAEPDCTMWVPDGWRAEPRAARRVGRRAAELAMDPATLQVWISRLTGVADEMGAVLRRAAYSPNIKERADCSCALFTADGTLLVQAEHIPVHLGSMPAAVRAAIDACGAERRVRRSDRRQRSVRGRHPSERRHVRRPRVRRRRHAARLGREPRAPRRPRRHGAGIVAARRDRDLPGGTAHPAGALDARGRGARRRRVAHARGTARRSRRATRRQPARRGAVARAAARDAPEVFAEIVDYGERRMRAAIARARRRCVFASRTCSTRPAARVNRARPRIARRRHGRRRRRSRSTSPAPTRNARAR